MELFNSLKLRSSLGPSKIDYLIKWIVPCETPQTMLKKRGSGEPIRSLNTLSHVIGLANRLNVQR